MSRVCLTGGPTVIMQSSVKSDLMKIDFFKKDKPSSPSFFDLDTETASEFKFFLMRYSSRFRKNNNMAIGINRMITKVRVILFTTLAHFRSPYSLHEVENICTIGLLFYILLFNCMVYLPTYSCGIISNNSTSIINVENGGIFAIGLTS